jgi:simple sugar transport system ATP-binding protein
VIAVRHVSKTFGHVAALRDVECHLDRGEVVALVGDNGAGKSTLMKVMCGALAPDDGTVEIEGEPLRHFDARATDRHGIGVVYQDLALAPDLRVYENFFLGHELPRRGPLGRCGLLDRKAMASRCRQALDELGVATLKSVDACVQLLSGGQRQAVAIARALAWSSTAVVMDEPTAALGVRQTELVCRLVRAIADRGMGVLMISHDMPRVIEIADRILVMRHGSLVADLVAAEATIPQIVEVMLGAEHGSRREQAS